MSRSKCPCGNETNDGVKCIPCQIDDKNPGLREFVMEIRGKVKIHREGFRKHRNDNSPYSSHFQKKDAVSEHSKVFGGKP